MNKLPIVTIDGPSGVGKSSIAVLLANKLGIPTLDTGAMFRVLALQAGPDSANFSDDMLEKIGQSLSFSLEGSGNRTRLLFNGKPAGNEIRTEEVGARASALASRPVVRQILLAAQRLMGEQSPLVAEGRDMGTVVFPNAAFKFFLDANPRIRALRRWRQYKEQGISIDLLQLEREIQERDNRDRTRAIAPLKPAEDAIIIDTSDIDMEMVLNNVYADILARGGNKAFPVS